MSWRDVVGQLVELGGRGGPVVVLRRGADGAAGDGHCIAWGLHVGVGQLIVIAVLLSTPSHLSITCPLTPSCPPAVSLFPHSPLSTSTASWHGLPRPIHVLRLHSHHSLTPPQPACSLTLLHSVLTPLYIHSVMARPATPHPCPRLPSHGGEGRDGMRQRLQRWVSGKTNGGGESAGGGDRGGRPASVGGGEGGVLGGGVWWVVLGRGVA